MLFSVSLAEKLASKGVLSYSLYPGRIKTGIAQSIPLEELRALGKFSLYDGPAKMSRLHVLRNPSLILLACNQ